MLLRIMLLTVGVMLVVRVWRASALHAILSMIIPGYVIVPMVRYWKEPDHDIRWHVALLFTCALTVVWLQYKLARDYAAEQAQLQAQLLAAEEGDDAEPAETAAPTTVPTNETEDAEATLAAVRRTHPLMSASRNAPQLAMALPVEKPAIISAPSEPAAVRSEVPMTFARAAAEAKFMRGKFELASMGLALDLPDHFHAFGSVDARRLETSLGLPTDPREIAWVLHENVPLSGTGSWHVRVRWLGDGWVAPATSAADGERLLRLAQHSPVVARLAGSGGALLGYAVAPTFGFGLADWVEERLPEGANASVLDCHAVRLGRKGALEFSIVGAPAGAQTLCDVSVRLLARRARIEGSAAYSPEPGADTPRAPYSLEQLVAQY